MKTFIVFVVLAFLMASCQKEEVRKTIIKQDVSFSLNLVDPMGLKDDDLWNFDCPVDIDGNLLFPTIAEIEVKDSNGVLITFYPLVFILNGKLYTQSIKLDAGTYELTKVLLLDEPGGSIIMATPSVGGLFAQYVSNPLAFEFEVSAFAKAQLETEVLCYSRENFGEFGFLWFGVTEIVVRRFCCSGNICANGLPYAAADFIGSDYENITGGLQAEMPAIFKIHVYRTFNGQIAEMPHSPFTNLGNENQPLCVSYPDRIRIPGEHFSFDLYILVPDENGGFIYQYFHLFTSTDSGPLSTDPGSDNIVGFVLGNCDSSLADLQFNW